jgi:hypothetical protein
LGLLLGSEVIRKLALGVVTIVTRDSASEVPSEVIALLVQLNIMAFLRIRGDDLSRSMRTLIETKRSRRASWVARDGSGHLRARYGGRPGGERPCALRSYRWK